MQPARYHICQTETDVSGFSLYWYRCHLIGGVTTINHSLALAEMMGWQGGKWFLVLNLFVRI